MSMNYQKLNTLTGWLVFAIATFVYVATLEPTASFWDCGEYIASASKLQVGHPPGAPLFQLIGAFFSIFTFGDFNDVAYAVNLISALSSSFTILFLFWTITAFARKIVGKDENLTKGNTIAILGSGLVGALAYTFSDSFWFSAVEGEVYAMSSFFTAISFWFIMKWEREADRPRANRWLLLIAFCIGLSAGVHFLVILTIPAITMIYYFKKFKPTTRGFILANILSVLILGVIFKVIFPVLLKIASKMDIFFVNTLGMPFNSGTIFTLLLTIGVFTWGLYYSRKKGRVHWNSAILAIIFILIGYSSFVTLVVRSNANTPIDENNPEDAVSLLSYLNREQYGDWPTLYGAYYNAPLDRKESYVDGTPVYVKDYEKKRYVISDDRKKSIPNFADSHKGVFPRMWSHSDPQHGKNYEKWSGMKKKPKRKPTFGQNLRFFFSYQLNYMYIRYFMWNFAGRQNDIQGRGEITKGNWISGIDFLDQMRLGPQDNLPEYVKNNPGRNKYYFLPLILGILGLAFHYKKSKKDTWVVMLFFLLTGIAIVVYLNQYAYQPRERDYAYVGSFYAFAIWIGLGVMAVYDFLKDRLNPTSGAAAATVLCLVLVPALMAKENWDDHNRAKRYTARDIAKNYLDSCDKDAILFTNGDNDTFPLWYVQEVEGYRTDVRVVNLSLLNTDWYIDQMKRAAYDGKPVPFSLTKEQYRQGTRDHVIFYDQLGMSNRRLDVRQVMNFIKSDDPKTKLRLNSNKSIDFFPTKKLRIPVNKENVLKNNLVAAKDTNRILPYIDWNMNLDNIYKKELMILDLIANNNWERPIYFSITIGNSQRTYMYLTRHFQLEGLAYKLVPLDNGLPGRNDFNYGKINTEKMYDNFMNKYHWETDMTDPSIYMDETNRRLSLNLRNIVGRLASRLIAEGKNDKAIAALDRVIEMMPEDKYPYDNYFVLGLAEAYYKAKETDKAKHILGKMAKNLDEEMVYYNQFKGRKKESINQDFQISNQYYQQILRMVQQYEIMGSDQKLEDHELYKNYQNTLSLMNS